MKKIAVKYCMLLFVLAICLGSCKEEEVYTTFPAPVWQVDDAKYSVSMTAVVVLPENLQTYFQTNDHIAAFMARQLHLKCWY